MFIYNKLEDSIDIYNLEAKTEEIKKYRQRILNRVKKQEPLFYYLKTNSKNTIDSLKKTAKIDLKLLSYEEESILDYGAWSNLYEVAPQELDREKEDIIEAYIAGKYDKFPAINVFKYNWQTFQEEPILNLIFSQPPVISNSTSRGNIYQVPEILNLPKNLYLLHLLQQGKFAAVADENITKLLKMFEVEYVKNVKLKEIEEMLETGLVDGTIERATKRAETGSKIYQKIKKSSELK